jgi:hypothetical protein
VTALETRWPVAVGELQTSASSVPVPLSGPAAVVQRSPFTQVFKGLGMVVVVVAGVVVVVAGVVVDVAPVVVLEAEVFAPVVVVEAEVFALVKIFAVVEVFVVLEVFAPVDVVDAGTVVVVEDDDDFARVVVVVETAVDAGRVVVVEEEVDVADVLGSPTLVAVRTMPGYELANLPSVAFAPS